ncbi:MAG: DUF4114 domain-containing protein [Deltaproteobacteria bacterium]|nr:DUF4114 domain-containing protein [Deltaproteobacteria bacterium]
MATLTVGDAGAVVNQVDGQVVPQTTRLQQCLTASEGAGPPIGTDAVFDAALQPEVFLPVPDTDVVFRDLAEGAGYENSFGWYNVGDDVTQPANLHVIFGCRGTPTCDCPCAVGNQRETRVAISNDPAYSGGYIGFWLRTPERNQGGNDPDNCGGVNDTANRIYFTESALNDDGDYVHYLIYESRQIVDTFYFGFEDLFRGGDNDFEDMLVRVAGLIPPCSPRPEECNDLDDDCDSEIDDDLEIACSSECGDGVRTCVAGAWGACDAPQPVPETCNGADDDCDGEADEGLSRGCSTDCGAGTEICADGFWVDCDAEQPAIEICNGQDDDCDGDVDGMTRPCPTACGPGDETCEDGEWVDCDAPQPGVEDCDGLDDDCNGEIDEGIQRPCASDCGVGSEVCANGVYIDCDAPQPVDEVCDGLDDDCDGDVDEGLSRACETQCGAGTEMCELGLWVGCDAPVPAPETCNALDDDCDGSVDEGNPGGGQRCGEAEGECAEGVTQCVAGAIDCVGDRGPVPEECNGLDDDCDGDVDDGNPGGGGPCGNDLGECELGSMTCVDGHFECLGESAPSPEECNGLDDDCDGVIDDGNPGGGLECDADRCRPGETRCVDGEVECVGGADAREETCNCLDDDCDGEVDEDAESLCPEGARCIGCGCALPCSNQEFELECPPGKECSEGFCVAGRCADVECDEGEVCRLGECIDLCGGVSCREGFACSLGRCIEDNCYGRGCPAGEICLEALCEPGPCVGLVCEADEFCRSGECVRSCAGVECLEGETCRDGACKADPCAEVTCRSGRVCVDGACEDDECRNVACGDYRACVDGQCIDDPCAHIDCPEGEACVGDQCVEPPAPAPTVGRRGLATGGGGCVCGVATGAGSSSALACLAVVLLLGVLRRRLHAALLIGTFGAWGCAVDPYCFDCPEPGAQDGGQDAMAVPDGCVSQGQEVCDGEDNDCNGRADETFEFDSDPANCGGCGALCVVPQAVPACEAGRCSVRQCDIGWVDLDGLPENGCEYECLPAGDEVCNDRDDDCDFATDEGFELETDLANCGVCGNVCAFGHGQAACVDGACELEECDVGFVDLDGDPEDGCEYPCGPGTAETCDGRDNDCDGEADEGFDLAEDEENCGACGRTCEFDNASGVCGGGECGLGQCDEGFVDLNGLPSDGCEYACDDPGADETCDGQDNDCDGLEDEEDPLAGDECGDADGECEPGVWTCSRGVLACAGGRGPSPERCDGLDNDCDLQVDAGNPQGGARCGTNVGACEFGSVQCQGGALVCAGGDDGDSESCNGVDDDCDGAVDDGNPDGGGACGSGEGECMQGIWTCVDGDLACTGGIESTTEACNGLDDDCDGIIDDGNPGGGARCGTNVGRCEYGTVTCQLGVFDCTGGVEPADEECNGLDDDCDGGVDEGLALDPPEICDQDGACAGTVATCAGADGWRCEYDSPYQPVELWCDGVDNDCDRTTDEGCKTLSPSDARVDLFSSGTEPSNSIQPALTGDGADRVFVAWLDRRNGRADVYYNRASAAAFGWPNPDTAVETNGANGVGPAVSFGDARLYVAWEDFRDDSTRRNVYFRRTTSNGQGNAFEAAESRVNTGLDNDSFGVQLAADGADGVFVAWETQLPDRSRRIYVASSRNEGGAFDPPDRVDTNPDAVPLATTPSIAAPAGGDVFVAWRDTRDGEPDIRFNRSLDGGVTWLGADVRLDTDLPGDAASIQPQVAADPSGNVVVVWSDERNGVFDVFAQRSTDGGDTWLAADVRVDTDPFAHDSFKPRVVVSGGVAWCVWEDYRDGLADIRVSRSDDAGATWLTEDLRADTDDEGVGGSTDPVLAVDAGVLYVAWLDDRDGERDVYLNFALDGLTLQPADLRLDTSAAGSSDSASVVLYAAAGRAHAAWIDYRGAGQNNGDIYHRFIR